MMILTNVREMNVENKHEKVIYSLRFDTTTRRLALCLDLHTHTLLSAKIWQVKVCLVCVCKFVYGNVYQILSFFGWWHDIGRDTPAFNKQITIKSQVVCNRKIYLGGVYDESLVVFVNKIKLAFSFQPFLCITDAYRIPKNTERFCYKYIVFTQGYIINYTNEYLIRYLDRGKRMLPSDTVRHMMFLGVKHGFLSIWLSKNVFVCVKAIVLLLL